jgi:anaerobic magnesium-protoporphyrin IX monomethyl ester cyclase
VSYVKGFKMQVTSNSSDGCDVLLVGYEDEENLGLRYIAAYLSEHGVSVGIEPYNGADSHRKVFERIVRDKPSLVGFSIIFQRMLYDFGELADYLRDNGVSAHFTCGGHFPTVEAEKTLKAIPALDSVIRHEGEETLLELFEELERPERWPGVSGFVYREDGGTRVNPPRPLIEDLDALPYPTRGAPYLKVRGLNVASITASRGCYYDCSFCSVQTFYREPPGPMRRSRSPENVVDEMEKLFYENGIRIFIFKDDDISTTGKRQGEWIERFATELEKRKLTDEILFRMSCRVDEFDEGKLARFKDVGLTALYLGIESGNEQGLKTYNKRYSVADVRSSLDVLRRLEIPFEFGFMIFEPGTTPATMAEDVAFLKDACSDGWTVVDFTKMFPYAGTPIARKLEDEGRLRGTLASPDYEYEDRRVSLLQAFFSQAFHFRNFEGAGLVSRLRTAKFDAAIVEKFFYGEYDAEAYAESVRELIKRDNAEVLETMSLAVRFAAERDETEMADKWDVLRYFEEGFIAAERHITAELDRLMAAYGFRFS